MPLPIIPNVYRVTFNYSNSSGVTAHNVLHFLAASGDEEDLGDEISSNLSSNMFAPLYNGVRPDTFTILKLDGSSAGVEYVNLNSADGQGSGEAVPAAAAVLSLRTATRGPRGRGRLFLGPVTEDQLDSGRIDSVVAVNTVTAWETFAAAMAIATKPMVVASYTHSDAEVVTGFSMRSAAGTLRRRQNQLL